jgi:hypothetical protein
MFEAIENVSDLVTEIAACEPDAGGMSSEEHAFATGAAQGYLTSPREHWPIREDDRNMDNVLFKAAWAKDRPCPFDVAVKDEFIDVHYVRSAARELIKPGHGIMFTASLSAFIPLGVAVGPKFSVFYTVRGMTVLRRAAVQSVIKIDALLDSSDGTLDLSPVKSAV